MTDSYCGSCGAAQASGAGFCAQCGAPQTVTAPEEPVTSGPPQTHQWQGWEEPVLPAPRKGRGTALVIGAAAALLVVSLGAGLWWLLGRTGSGDAQGSEARQTKTATAQVTATVTAVAPAAPTAAPSTTAALPTIRDLPAGTVISVLQSMPQGEFTEAQAWQRAKELSVSAHPLVVVDSSSVSGLNAGYWALSVVQRDGVDGASICSAYGRAVGGTCYDRRVT